MTEKENISNDVNRHATWLELFNDLVFVVVILSSVIGSINFSLYVSTISSAFSSKFTSLDQFSEFTATNSSSGPPSGYEQAREDPSYAINIPFSDLGSSPFEPSVISIPANMTIICFNEDDSPQFVTFNDINPEAIQPATIAPGGFFIHKFTEPGIYDYYNSENLSAKGSIKVGTKFEPGQNMNMLVGGDALPFEAGKIGRTTFSFVPHDNVTTIPPSLSITYNVTIVDSNGTHLYSNQFEDSDGILDLELIPTSSSRSSLSSSNQTGAANQTSAAAEGGASNQTGQPQFVTWGSDLTDQEGVASDGAYHVQGPVMTENEDYTIIVSITNIDNTAQHQLPSDDFLIPSVNFIADSNAANFLFLDPVG